MTDDLYFCPTAREVESATGGGFDVCCSRPDLHVPMPDGPGTEAVSLALSEAAKREYALGQRAKQAERQVQRIRHLHSRYRDAFAVGDNDSCAHCNQLTGEIVPWPCDMIRALDEETP